MEGRIRQSKLEVCPEADALFELDNLSLILFVCPKSEKSERFSKIEKK
jgi:hypothetical protein